MERVTSPMGLHDCRIAIESACSSLGVHFPPSLLDKYEDGARRKFEAHAWTWESRSPLVLLSARWVGRLAGELAVRDGRTVVTTSDAELAFRIAREVCHARAPKNGHRLDWCPDGPPRPDQMPLETLAGALPTLTATEVSLPTRWPGRNPSAGGSGPSS
jgi:hypothetical protein